MTLTIEKPAPNDATGARESADELGKVIPLAETPSAPDGPEGGENGPVDREPPRPDHGGRRDDRPPRPPRWKRILGYALLGLIVIAMLIMIDVLTDPKERDA